MKQRIRSITRHRLVWSLVLTGSSVLGFAAEGAGPSAAPSSPSATRKALTLKGAISLALDSNPTLRASSGRIDAASGRAYQSKFWTNPELTLNAEEWPVSGGGEFSDSKQTVGLAQTIPFPGKKKLDRQIGASGVRFSVAELSLRKLELVRDVKTAFYGVLAAERLVGVQRELVNVAESSAATARKRVAAGAAADQEQLRAEILLEQARSELAGFQRELVTARQTLAFLVGRPEFSDIPVSGALAEHADLTLFDERPEQWLAGHPSVLAVQTRRDRAELKLRRARLEPYPDVRMGVAGGRLGETDQSIIELGLSVPLPIIDRSKGRKQEAEAEVRIAEAERLAVEQSLLRAWSTASMRYRTAVEQVGAYRERILPKTNEALRLVQTGFEQGKFGFMDLLDTQRTTAEARLAYQRKLLELNVAQAELEALLDATPLTGQPPFSTGPK
jgi:cobalt-zinc-cadmium efflux system outer membrane protein